MDRLQRVIDGLGRRQFFSRAVLGGGALLGGVFGKFATTVAAHDERLSMAAAQQSTPFGIATYRVRLSGSEVADHIIAELLDRNGDALGEFARKRLYDSVVEEVYAKGEEFKLNKTVKRTESLLLQWGSDSMELLADKRTASWDVKFNNHWVATVTFGNGQEKIHQAALDSLLAAHGTLFTLVGAIGSDLDIAFPKSPRVAPGCCCNVGCYYVDHSCWDYGTTRTIACQGATDCLNSDCWNSYCIGCCWVAGCDCACYDTTDFLCTCINHGQSCGCDNPCQ